MKNQIYAAIAGAIFISSAFVGATARAQNLTPLWQVGNVAAPPQNSPIRVDTKFSDDADFQVNAASSASWPLVQPGPKDGWAGSREHTFRIHFDIATLGGDGSGTLTIQILGAHPQFPPRLLVAANDKRVVNAAVNAGAKTEIKLNWPASTLKVGRNTLALTTKDGSWLVYKAIQMTTSAKTKLVPSRDSTSIVPLSPLNAPPKPLPDWALGPFVRPKNAAPLISPNKNSTFDDPMRERPVNWEALHTFNPAATVKDGKIVVLYRAEDDSGTMKIGAHTSRLGYAESSDGIHFTRLPAPVFYPAKDAQKDAEWEGGCEDPRLIATEDGAYVLTYTQWNHEVARLAVAASNDLRTWTKYGSVFAKFGNGYADKFTKSGAIVGRVKDGVVVATKINGLYWMYWGEGEVYLASSPDLINWTPLERDGKLLPVLDRRKGKFDSNFAEAGPPPILTDKGILVLYNGKNSGSGDPSIGNGVYAGGQALFDRNDPTKLLARLDEPFIKPELAFEKSGQYAAGTTFIEGLVPFRNKWFLFYGTADSFVGVAIHDPKRKGK